ncbi:MAG: Lrp/AsnC family transcriptional regulator, partial [Candidatus Bathyarchaeia archaeon]
DHRKLDFGVTAFILASFSYRTNREEAPLSQRAIAEQISKFPEAQEVHIISGDWDILIKVKDKNVDSVGRFVIDKLRTVKGIEKTLTCIVFDTPKETTTIPIPVSSKVFQRK